MRVKISFARAHRFQNIHGKKKEKEERKKKVNAVMNNLITGFIN